jgi:hypothetical protein
MPITPNSRRAAPKYSRPTPTNAPAPRRGNLSLPGRPARPVTPAAPTFNRPAVTPATNRGRLPGLANLGGCAPCRKAAQMRAAARLANATTPLKP